MNLTESKCYVVQESWFQVNVFIIGMEKNVIKSVAEIQK